ncbi:hypothetical protein BC835DRAFT_1306237 [Cytidiella melzeri]|nr:hypothetical protein BC835DRAFT_1306237 [Cytidiella melzeri]
MSNSTSSYTPEDIAGLQAIQVGNFINIALMFVVLYDVVITFGQEIEVIWCYGTRGKNTIAASILFLANRYLAILYGIVGFVAGTVPLTTTCTAVTRLTEAIVLGLILCFALISAYRVYALQVWKCQLLAALVFLLNLVPFTINLYAFTRYTPAAIGPSFSPCAVIDPLAPALEIQFVRACRLSAIAADALVLLLTLAKTVPNWIEARKLKIAVPLSTALIQDGSAYFCVLLIMNIFQMITFAVWETEFLTTFIYILTPVLSCRLILNLRQVNNKSADQDFDSHLLYQLDAQHDLESQAVEKKLPNASSFNEMGFGNLNLDAFDNITTSPSDLSSSSEGCPSKAPSLQDARFPDISLNALQADSSDSSTDLSQMSSSAKQDNEIQEVHPSPRELPGVVLIT